MSKRIVSFVLVFVTIFLMVPVASADYTNTAVGVWESALHGAVKFGNDIPLVGPLIQCSFGELGTSVCSQSSDGFHHTPSLQGCSTGEDSNGLYANATCQYCNQSFKAYSSELKAAYENQVDDLPVNGISSDGGYLYTPDLVYQYYTYYLSSANWRVGSGDLPSNVLAYELSSGSYTAGKTADGWAFSFIPPSNVITGGLTVKSYYGLATTLSYPATVTLENAGEVFFEWAYKSDSLNPQHSGSQLLVRTSPIGEPVGHFSAGSDFLFGTTNFSVKSVLWYNLHIKLPTFRVVPDEVEDTPDFTVVNNAVRMGNIGGNYGIINNDNSVTQYTTQYIVNETSNTYTNPATGETQAITDWAYNYDNRSYTLTLEGGDTTTVTYADDSVSINETTIDGNGNTVNNHYEINYIVNNGGGSTTDPDPSASPSPSNNPGGGGSGSGSGSGSNNPLSRVFANYAAQITQAYGTDGHGGTDCIPSSGVADTVTAHSEGDVVWVQTGQDNNQGSSGDLSYGNAVKVRHANGYYTLYAHLAAVEVAQGDHVYKGQALGMMGNTGNSYGAHLHFEVRDDTDTRLNSDPYLNADLPGLSGGGSSGGGILDKLGELIGVGINGLLQLGGAVISKVLDGLIALLEMLVGKLTEVVETVLSIFDQIPALFGGFLDLLGLLFPFLPPEINTLLTFGIIAVVAIWIIRALLGK